MSDVEDQIAHQLALLDELREMRQAATDPRTKAYLQEQIRHARVVLDWLRDLRAEMQRGPQR